MFLEDYISGKYIKQYEYKSFSPNKINTEWNWQDLELNLLLENSNRLLGELNAFSIFVDNIDLFIKMHILKEANKSSKIEGTKTEMEEDLLSIDEISIEKRDDWDEVQNYIKAINFATNRLQELPLSSRLIKETHSILLSGVRGKNKLPGEFRKSQNWIGGNNLKNALFIPPIHTEIPELISDLEKFINNFDYQVPNLVKSAIIHYQFETIHPFLDGNGRIGRLIIILYLLDKKIIKKPSLYISDYFERNRMQYYMWLEKVRTENDMLGWIKFFLKGIIETSEKGITTFQGIQRLEKVVYEKIYSLGRQSKTGIKLLEYLFRKPVITIKDVSEELNITPKTTNSIIEKFIEIKILKEITGNQRNRIFIFEEYYNLF